MIIKINKPLTKKKLDDAEQTLIKKRAKKRGFNAKKFAGKLKGVFGDPLEYQKKLRDEWK